MKKKMFDASNLKEKKNQINTINVFDICHEVFSMQRSSQCALDLIYEAIRRCC